MTNSNPSIKEYGHQKVISKNNIPDVANLLIVGESDSSLLLSENLMNLAKFTRIIHVKKPEDALTVIMIEEFGVIILDDDAIDSIELSRIIKINLPLVRIIVISQNITKNFLIDLINLGSVETFIQLPVDDFVAHNLILEQQAKFEINQTLNQFITQPPKFTPAYYSTEDPSLEKDPVHSYELVGVVISYQSLTRYVYFRRDYLNTDEILLSGYMSAITMLGQSIFNQSTIDSIDFGGICAIFKSRRDLNFAYFIEGLSKDNFSIADSFLEELTENILFDYTELLIRGEAIEREDSNKINAIIENMIDAITVSTKQKEKSTIIAFGKQFLKLSVLLNNLENVYDIKILEEEEDVYRLLRSENIDVVIATPILTSKKSHLGFAARVIDISPNTQIIGINYRFEVSQLIKILNSGVVSRVLNAHISEDEFRYWLKKAVEDSHTIDMSSNYNVKHRILISRGQFAIPKTRLRKDESQFLPMKHPEFYGIFIARDSLPYYSKFYYSPDYKQNFDDVLFSGFISSLESFSNEMFDTTEPYTGIVLNSATLIIYNYFGFTFAFFIGEIDDTNYKFANILIAKSVQILFEIITNSENSAETSDIRDYDANLPKKIDQVLNELFIKFTSLSFEN